MGAKQAIEVGGGAVRHPLGGVCAAPWERDTRHGPAVVGAWTRWSCLSIHSSVVLACTDCLQRSLGMSFPQRPRTRAKFARQRATD
jgi:hypothetical protein